MAKSKVHSYKGWKIQQVGDVFNVYTADEWQYGSGLRNAEWEAGSLEEAKEFIDAY